MAKSKFLDGYLDFNEARDRSHWLTPADFVARVLAGCAKRHIARYERSLIASLDRDHEVASGGSADGDIFYFRCDRQNPTC